MRILVTGDRFWFSPPLAAAVLGRLVKRYGPDLVIVHGGATGIDESFATACRGFKIKAEAHPVTDSEWKRVGTPAGPRRNARMIATGVDMCLVFHKFLANSKGSKDCARQAIAAGVRTYLIDSDKAIPKRLRADDPRLE